MITIAPGLSSGNRFGPGRWRARPSETEMSSNLFQSVGVCREIDMRENKRKQIHRVPDGVVGGQAFRRLAMTLAHSFKEGGLIAAEMNQSRIRDWRKDIYEFAPYELLLVFIICPKAMLNSTIAGSDADADQVVKIAIGQTFDIQIY